MHLIFWNAAGETKANILCIYALHTLSQVKNKLMALKHKCPLPFNVFAASLRFSGCFCFVNRNIWLLLSHNGLVVFLISNIYSHIVIIGLFITFYNVMYLNICLLFQTVYTLFHYTRITCLQHLINKNKLNRSKLKKKPKGLFSYRTSTHSDVNFQNLVVNLNSLTFASIQKHSVCEHNITATG